eukprot:9195650-Heterocapsa_arctica.AAC.1
MDVSARRADPGKSWREVPGQEEAAELENGHATRPATAFMKSAHSKKAPSERSQGPAQQRIVLVHQRRVARGHLLCAVGEADLARRMSRRILAKSA